MRRHGRIREARTDQVGGAGQGSACGSGKLRRYKRRREAASREAAQMGEAVVLCYPGGGAGREWLAMEETRERRRIPWEQDGEVRWVPQKIALNIIYWRG